MAKMPFSLSMQFTADIIAQYIGGTVEGNGNIAVSNFAKIEEARQGNLTFLANPKYEHFVYSTKASIILVRNDFKPEKAVEATLIHVEDPYSALAQLMNLAAQAIKPNPQGIHSLACIEPDAQVAQDCYVGAFAYIGNGAKIESGAKIYPQVYIGPGCTVGAGTIVYPGAKIYYGCKIGQNCVIHSGAVIGADGFGFAPDSNGVYHKIEQLGIVEIADDVEIGANTTIDRSTMGRTYIDRGVKLDNLIQIAHNASVGHDTVIAAQTGVAGSTSLGANCIIAGQVGFAGHISIGDNVTIGAQSGIPNHVASGARLMGYPAVPAGDFARSVVYQKQLPDLYKRVKELENKIAELTKNDK